ncbi:DUF4738 domain-containing protein [Mucilaginibacter jinjuensis]|uniref:DUF4738 domain-containing protein n=1 Tax=Mucilaginibacter jinjuensis TaxID=1176721 RepID=A0ABY7TC45_9SPHI|nr:DUF4738 domain-containing protein [Mucilaginibacter jinjuensis]WCT13645.1 DUF4738 domain-containing protein [Mucilaginibacter jinjuensis]
MNKSFSILLLIAFGILTSCNSQSSVKSTDSSNVSDTSKKAADAKQKAIDAQMAEGARPESEEESPSPTEERELLSKSYNEVKKIDTVLKVGSDSLHLKLKYYCIKDSSLVIPKKYVFGEKSPRDFITHDFASDIVITQNGNIIFNKTIKKGNFSSVITDQLKSYGILMKPYLSSTKGDKNQVALDYSISIPGSEIGSGVTLIIDKNGDYKVAKN